MLKVNIVGFGNLGYSLAHALLKNPTVVLQNIVSSKQIASKDCEKLRVEKVEELSPAQLTILAVPDTMIVEVSEQLPYENSIIVHTSGATDFRVMSSKNKRGVFYPLQSFSKAYETNFLEVPICVEGETEEVKELLLDLAKSMSNRVYEMDFNQRAYLHLVAVFMNNFTNHLVALGQELATQQKIPLEIFEPILQQTMDKWKQMPAKEAQTGPASRGDEVSIEKHLSLLSGNKELQEIYQLLSKSIIKNGKKL